MLVLASAALTGGFFVGCGPLPAPSAAGTEQASQPSSDSIPIDADDAISGSALAPVTLVAFLDFECFFCGRAHETLLALRQQVPPEELRIVVKHAPLPFHARALPAAVASSAVLKLAGHDAFFEYLQRLFADPKALTDANLKAWAVEVGVAAAAFERALGDAELAEAIERDLAQAQALGVNGVPAFFINGASIVGARPAAEFGAAIQHELRAGRALLERGQAPQEVYAARVQVNLRQAASDAPADADVAWQVPVASSPALGPANAWVTLVEFADFECAFCGDVHARIERLIARYPGRVRWVMKHNPLGFHPHAEPAALLALAVREQHGDAAYWRVVKSLLALPKLDAPGLVALARGFGLDAERYAATRALGANHPQLVADRDLAMDLSAEGTPYFFINGRRVAGAQPDAVFEQILTQELSRVERLWGSSGAAPGFATPYDALQATATPAPGLERVAIDPPDASTPTLGPETAPVVVQMFSDFECGYCRRVLPTLDALRARYPEQIRVVWRHLPLPFHAQAKPAARVALAVREQRGDAAFWALAQRLLAADGSEPQALDRAALLRFAQQAGVAQDDLEAALDGTEHDAAIERDVALAGRLGISGTPTFVINGYRLVGAQPLPRFERLVRLALADLPQ